ncbi:MAG: peptide chain release factor N(5)-glutamine methyltransferase [Anaerolineae bacterium]|nr:peptide chain release factor N(5)-glutamine methyltransferase [Anaerolineae bacterium]
MRLETGQMVGEALRQASRALGAVSGSPQLDAGVLLAAMLGVERTALLAHPERLLTPDQAAHYAELVARAAEGTPIPYLTGWRAFYHHDFIVTPDVLIPRPETEHLVDAALAWAQTWPQQRLTIVDVGTGSGAIALSLAAALPGATVYALDCSAVALEVARRNAIQIGVSNVRFGQGDLLTALPDGVKPDLIVANLPYIPSADLEALAVARHEPRLALDGGLDGLDVIRRLAAEAADRVPPTFALLLEIGAGQGRAVSALCRRAFPGARVRVLPDYAGHDRIVEVTR